MHLFNATARITPIKQVQAGRISRHSWPKLAQYGKALEASPADVKILNNLGVALACKGRYEEAVIRFREALGRSPGYQEARDNLAKVMMELKGSVRP